MRLTPRQAQSIKEVIQQFDADAEIFLFGSRTDDAARGGDIDLLIFSQSINVQQKIELKLRLIDQLGPQKIDLVIAHDEQRPFVRLARSAGVRL